mmetsp:Transcript_8543/g.29323  ORF Transcript_8543/g.29323 Transcript_8543/m.29323 type:complete len:496 (+) Transcript_8543:1669-3156(+)
MLHALHSDAAHLGAEEAHDPHEALGEILVLLALGHLHRGKEALKRPLGEGQHLLLCEPGLPVLLERQGAFEAGGCVRVHHVALRPQELHDRAEERQRRLSRQLAPEGDHKLKAVGLEHGKVVPRGGELWNDVLLEELPNVDELVGGRRPGRGRLAPHREGHDQIHRAVLGLPVRRRVLLVLPDQNVNVCRAQLGQLFRKLFRQALHQLAARPPPGVRVAALHIPSDVLHEVHLEELLLVLAHPQVGDHHALTYLLHGLPVLEELVMDALRHRGQESDGRRGEPVLVGGGPNLKQQAPNVCGEGLQVRLEFLLVLLNVHVHILADGGLDPVQRGLLVILAHDSGVLIIQELVKRAHPVLHGVLKDLRQLLGVQREVDPKDDVQVLQGEVQRDRVLRPLHERALPLEEVQKGLGALRGSHKIVQNVLELPVQLVALVLVPVRLEDRARGAQGALQHVLVRLGELAHQLGNKVLPLVRKVGGADDREGLAQLELDVLW